MCPKSGHAGLNRAHKNISVVVPLDGARARPETGNLPPWAFALLPAMRATATSSSQFVIHSEVMPACRLEPIGIRLRYGTLRDRIEIPSKRTGQASSGAGALVYSRHNVGLGFFTCAQSA